MVAFEGTDPRTATLKDATTVSGAGFLLTNDSTTNKLDLTAASDRIDAAGGTMEVAIGISAGESSRDADLVLETTGATVSFFPLGGVHLVASDAVTWTVGQLAYVNANGRCTNVAGSNKKLGVYVGTGETVATAGDKVAINTATHVNA